MMATTMTTELTLEQRRLARRAVSARANLPVVLVQGESKPELVGESWHYETRTGIRIYYPSAYSRKGWSGMVYCPSTRKVIVGQEWFKGKA